MSGTRPRAERAIRYRVPRRATTKTSFLGRRASRENICVPIRFPTESGIRYLALSEPSCGVLYRAEFHKNFTEPLQSLHRAHWRRSVHRSPLSARRRKWVWTVCPRSAAASAGAIPARCIIKASVCRTACR
jgi:hypothetical protein